MPTRSNHFFKALTPNWERSRLLLPCLLILAAAALHADTATDTPTPTPGTCAAWSLLQDWRLAPNEENPERDACGNPGVWACMGGTGLHDPGSYYVDTIFAMRSGTECWHGNEFYNGDFFPQCRINPTGAAVDLTGGGLWLPPGHSFLHPGPTQPAIIRWRSGYNGVVRARGTVADSPVPCGNGILWYLDQGSTTLTSGGYADQGPGQAFDLTVSVSVGDDLYLIIDANAGDYDCDSTDVVLDIQALSPTATPTPTASDSPSETETPTVSASPSDTATPTVSDSPSVGPTFTVTPVDPAGNALRVTIYNSAGELVRDLYSGHVSGALASASLSAGSFIIGQGTVDVIVPGLLSPGPITWDGLNASAQPVDPAVYVIKVEVMDGFGTVTAFTMGVTVLPPPTATPTASPTATPSSTATPSVTAWPSPSASPTASPTATPAPTFQVRGPGHLAMAPMPVDGGRPLCLSLDRTPAQSRWDIYSLGGEKVTRLEFGGQVRECWSTASVASGIYLVHLDVTYADGSHEERWKKVVVLR